MNKKLHSMIVIRQNKRDNSSVFIISEKSDTISSDVRIELAKDALRQQNFSNSGTISTILKKCVAFIGTDFYEAASTSLFIDAENV